MIWFLLKGFGMPRRTYVDDIRGVLYNNIWCMRYVLYLYSMGGQSSPYIVGWKSGPTSPPEMLALQTMDLKLRRSPFDHQSFVGFVGFVGFDWGRSGASQVGWTFPTLGCLNWIRNQFMPKKSGNQRDPRRTFFFFWSTSWVFAGKALPVPKYQGASPSGEANIF